MKVTEFPNLGEKTLQHKLDCGLEMILVPRPGFQRKLAYFVTDYGSIHTDYTLDGEDMTAPAGVAHFLEHKMFDLPGRDVSAEFASQGANVNAFTSYDVTAYYFTCTQNFEKNLELLLEFVSTPYFTEESVQKEMGIIDQEIGMNADAPDTRVFEDLMDAMFQTHPIRVPILGTSDTIRQITEKTLHDCHRSFYSPANMLLCVVGDVDPDVVVAIADKVLGTQPRSAGEKKNNWDEPMTVARPLVRRNMEIAMPAFQLGFKCEPLGKGEEAIRQEIVGDLAAEALFGESSRLYLELYEEGVIDSSFGGGFETIDGCALLTCGGDSEDAEKVRDAILRYGQQLAQEGISEEAFQRMKRSAMGRRVRDLDSFDSTCFRTCAYKLSDFDYFRFPEIYAAIQKEEIAAFIRRVVRQERCALSVIEPLA